jgi:hypothetical protein
MNKDPITHEIREHRVEILRRYGGSMARHHQEIQRMQLAFGQRLTTLPPKRILEPSDSLNGGPAAPLDNSKVT